MLFSEIILKVIIRHALLHTDFWFDLGPLNDTHWGERVEEHTTCRVEILIIDSECWLHQCAVADKMTLCALSKKSLMENLGDLSPSKEVNFNSTEMK